MQTVIKLFIFAAIYVIGIVNLAKTNTVWTGDLSYRLIHLLLFITSVLALISRMRPKAGQNPHPLYPVARWCFIIVCLFYALTYLSAIFITDLPLLLK
ncbi:hypothetical protein QVO10_09575 [Bacteroides gallinaceum]|uniref:Uncharacterized protein n=2 Tax=Bacteroidaceae TaxID=815 RepID=A0ABT7X6C1_9BACE|nr:MULTISPECIES: hypothetical protein [Bacteroidaceae]CCZ71471.1 putative uncharacterized protein [Bacteroides sp. CAG:702]MBD8040388.1 hypothetical protein [Phocaeicola intestinalis]MBM6657707.1 hypothetical protein [Bacteroides gallinaceum]MBM6719798.1 hypothetical protein [Bacteroides gallinaceum]MBM6944326.1 hypothetical protein [Bacteroides gallinaceum]